MGRNDPPAFAAYFLRLRRPMAALVALSLGMGVAGFTGTQAHAQSAEQQATKGESGGNALDALTSAIAKYKNNLQEIKDALEKSPEPSELTEELAKSKELIEGLTRRLTEVRDKRDVLAAELASQHETMSATIASMQLDLERDRTLMAQIQTELGQTKGELQETVNAREALEALLTEQQATSEELEQQLRGSLTASQRQVADLQSVRDELQGDLSEVRKTTSAEIEKLNGDIEAADLQIQVMSSELTKSQQQVEELGTTRDTLVSELEAVKQAAAAQTADLSGQIDKATNRANSLSQRLGVSEQQAIELQEAQQLLEFGTCQDHRDIANSDQGPAEAA